jgi:hypothetical protein
MMILTYKYQLADHFAKNRLRIGRSVAPPVEGRRGAGDPQDVVVVCVNRISTVRP